MYLSKQQKEPVSRIIYSCKKNNARLIMQRCYPNAGSLQKSRKFTYNEDSMIYKLRNDSRQDWDEIAKNLGTGKTARQIRDRYKFYLNPKQTVFWNENRNALLLEKVKLYGKDWNFIARFFPDETAVSLKNIYLKIKPAQYESISDILEDSHDLDDHEASPEYPYHKIPQLKRRPNATSSKKTFETPKHVRYRDVSYTTDDKGGIDFESPTDFTEWTNPVYPPKVNLSEKPSERKLPESIDSIYGLLQNGLYVNIKAANRAQHFNIANRIIKKTGSQSPSSEETWHHLVDYPFMVRVDRTVHSKYGHNGGFYLWKDHPTK